MRTQFTLRTVLVLILLVSGARGAHAQAFISPLIGYNFGGDAHCPQITNCEDKRLNAGVTLGVMGDVFGFEEEFAYAKDFLGRAPGLSSSVLTIMTNVMFIPAVGPIRPYAVVGIGLIKTHVELAPSSVFTSDNNNAGWDAGGGVMLLLGKHFGIRGDLRYFHSFLHTKVLGVILDGDKVDFGRASAAMVFRF